MTRSLAVLALSAIAVAVPAQDLTITFKSSDGTSATHYFSKDRVRMNGGRMDTMMEFASGKIVTIDNQKKEYSEMTLAEIDEAMKGMAAQMEQAMAQMPPQMRGQMAKMMGGAAEEVTMTKGGTRTIAGYSCQSYTVSMGASMTQETCNTTALKPPFDPANFAKLTRATVPMTQGMEKFAKKLGEVQGIALLQHSTTSLKGRKAETTIEATEIKKDAIPADVFVLPAGYKRVESPLKKMTK